MIGLVCLHGWAFDHQFWDSMNEEFANVPVDVRVITLDFGYFGQPAPWPALSNDRVWIGVGHSFGFAQLLDRLPSIRDQLAGLVSINGFTHFCESEENPTGWKTRVVKRMLRSLDDSPQTTIETFRKRCGAKCDVSTATRNDTLLACDLERLITVDHSSPIREKQEALAKETGLLPTLALASVGDPIVDAALTISCFEVGGRPADLIWHPTAGHCLPQDDPLWCVERILDFAKCKILSDRLN